MSTYILRETEVLLQIIQEKKKSITDIQAEKYEKTDNKREIPRRPGKIRCWEKFGAPESPEMNLENKIFKKKPRRVQIPLDH